MAMRGISHLDSVCLKEIFKNLQLLDLCSMRQCSQTFRDFVDDFFRSLVREQWLDLLYESNANVDTILNNFGKLVNRLVVWGNVGEPSVLDVIANNCCNILKGLSLNDLRLHKIDMRRFAGVFDNLETLELTYCIGNRKCNRDFLLGHEYPNLKELVIENKDKDEKQDQIKTKVLKQFFMRKRNIEQLRLFVWMSDDLLPLIALNATELEELYIWPILKNERNLMSLAQLRKLKRLEINCSECDNRSIIALIKELSINNELKMLQLDYFHFTTEFCDALSKLTNLKDLQLFSVSFHHVNDTKSIEMMAQKLSKLETLRLVYLANFPTRDFLASFCQSEKLRTIYIWLWKLDENNNFIELILQDFVNGNGLRCFVSGNPLCVHLHNETFDGMKDLLTQENLKLIEKYGNIKIFRACRFDFPTMC